MPLPGRWFKRGSEVPTLRKGTPSRSETSSPVRHNSASGGRFGIHPTRENSTCCGSLLTTGSAKYDFQCVDPGTLMRLSQLLKTYPVAIGRNWGD